MVATHISQKAMKILEMYMDSYEYFARDVIHVRDHNTSKILPLIFRPGQRVMHDVAEKRKNEKGFLRILLLKNRRFGGSTYIAGRGYHRAVFNFNTNVFIIGHETDSTNTLFKMVQLMQEKNPIAPATKTSNAQELIFDVTNKDAGPGLKSEYKLATAKNVEAGRSQGVHFLHCCLHEDSLIVLADGSTKKIKDVCQYDEVVTGSGELASVLKRFDTGVKQTYKVSTWLSNEPVAMTADHKVYTLDGVKLCRDLTEKDWILTPRVGQDRKATQKTFKFFLPNTRANGSQHKEEDEIVLDYDAGYYFGYYLAEGCISHQWKYPKACAVHFAYHENEKFIDKAHSFAIKHATSRGDYGRDDGTKRLRTYFYGVFLAELTKEVCGSAENKSIPNWFFNTPESFRLGVLNGYLDGDGSKTQKGKVSAVCIREKIARQIKRLVVSLGFGVPGFNYTKDRFRYEVKTSPVYTVSLNGDTERRYLGEAVGKPHKATKYKIVDGRFYVKVKRVEPFEIAQTYDIEVDHPDHNFETPIGVVSNSEEAMWPGHSDELLSSLFSTVPRPPAYTEIWRESTGKGYGNSFQLAVFDAYAEGKFPYYKAPLSMYAPHMAGSNYEFTFAYHNPNSDWIVIFIPWMIDPTCWKAFESQEKRDEFIEKVGYAQNRQDDINYEAMKLKQKFGLRWEQLYWREWAIVNECRGQVDFFQQENPHDLISAFRTKGSNHYSVELCDMVEKWCLEPAVVGNVVRRAGMAVIDPNPSGHIQVWERPNPHHEYFMTVDAAGGKREIHVKENREPDKTVIDVWNRQTGRQVAQWYGHLDYDLISETVVAIGEMYNRATACVELNNHGFKVVGDLKSLEYPQFYWKAGEAGWSTNRKTKPIMVDDLITACRAGTLTIRCKETVNEMRTYVEVSGRFGAEAGCKDDRVITAQIAAQMMTKLQRKVEMQDDYMTDRYAVNSGQAWMVS